MLTLNNWFKHTLLTGHRETNWPETFFPAGSFCVRSKGNPQPPPPPTTTKRVRAPCLVQDVSKGSAQTGPWKDCWGKMSACSGHSSGAWEAGSAGRKSHFPWRIKARRSRTLSLYSVPNRSFYIKLIPSNEFLKIGLKIWLSVFF